MASQNHCSWKECLAHQVVCPDCGRVSNSTSDCDNSPPCSIPSVLGKSMEWGQEMRSGVERKSPALSAPWNVFLLLYERGVTRCLEQSPSCPRQCRQGHLPRVEVAPWGSWGMGTPLPGGQCLAGLTEAVACDGHCCLIWSCAECHADVPVHLSNTSSYLLQLQRCHSVMLGVLDLDLIVFFLCLFQMNNCDSKMLW